MKWTKELDDELIRLIYLGKKQNEIAENFNVSKKAIQNRCFRLKIQVITHKEIVCKQCSTVIKDIVSSSREFCNNSCANTYSNTHRTHSQKTKNKISKSILEINSKKIKIEKVSKKRKCRFCQKFEVDKRYKTICEDCRYDYYKAYRPSCEFIFNVYKFPKEFELSLLIGHGWYSASNKGNNLKGVSRDHLYSVRDGFINKVDCEILKHPANCKLILHNDNNKKSFNSSITLEQLLERIDLWNNKYKHGSVARET